jgi:pilus assembly protein Flp/PilA
LLSQKTTAIRRRPVNHPSEEGATAVEYGLMSGLIAVIIAGAVTAFGIGVDGLFQSLLTAWPG